MTTPVALRNSDGTALPAAAQLLDALSRRDFDALARALAPSVAFRALVPRGPFELAGSAAVAAQFEKWFGGPDAFEIVDASIGPVGVKTYLRWRVRLRATDGAARVAEQHVFATGSAVLESINLLCSGFYTEGTTP